MGRDASDGPEGADETDAPGPPPKPTAEPDDVTASLEPKAPSPPPGLTDELDDVTASLEPKAPSPPPGPTDDAAEALEPNAPRPTPQPDAADEHPASPLLAALEDAYGLDELDREAAPQPSDTVRARRVAALRRRIESARRRLVPQLPEDQPTRPRRFWLLSVFVLRRWVVEDRCGGMAALLTMHTMLSTVPTIGVALLIVGLMDPDSGMALLEDLFRSLVPETERAAQMAHNAMKLAARVNVGTLGAWGFGVTLSIAFVLFSTLERTFNRIWRVTRRRSVLVKFTMFYTLATLGPAVMLYSLAEPLLADVTRAFALPVLTTGAALVLLNRYVPHTAVRWGPALAGGLISAVLIELGKVGFGYYATRFALATYEGLYGSLAIFPILMVWSYLSWMVILLGAEIAFVVQRRRYIALQGYLNQYVRERSEVPTDSGRTAARLLLAICDRYSRKGTGLGPEALGERFRLPLGRVGELLTQLERHGYIVDTDTDHEGQRFVPARPLDQLKLIDVLVLFEHEHAQRTRVDGLGRLFEDLDEARLHIVADTSFADLVSRPRR